MPTAGGEPKQPRVSTRAPVGSLANNPEWNGIILELEVLSKSDIMSYEQYLEW